MTDKIEKICKNCVHYRKKYTGRGKCVFNPPAIGHIRWPEVGEKENCSKFLPEKKAEQVVE